MERRLVVYGTDVWSAWVYKCMGNCSPLLSNWVYLLCICEHQHMTCYKITAFLDWGINNFIVTHGPFSIRVILNTKIYCALT